MDIHKLVLQVGLSMGSKLSNTTKPLGSNRKESKRFSKPKIPFGTFAVFTTPFIMLALTPLVMGVIIYQSGDVFNLLPLPIYFLLIFITTFGLALSRLIAQKRRLIRYSIRYGANV